MGLEVTDHQKISTGRAIEGSTPAAPLCLSLDDTGGLLADVSLVGVDWGGLGDGVRLMGTRCLACHPRLAACISQDSPFCS